MISVGNGPNPPFWRQLCPIRSLTALNFAPNGLQCWHIGIYSNGTCLREKDLGASLEPTGAVANVKSNRRPVLLRSETRGAIQIPWWGAQDAPKEPDRLLRACPRYVPTPLISLPGMADRAGIGQLWIKDETQRLGIGSFKGLGGAYAVLKLAMRYVEKITGRAILPAELLDPGVRSLFSALTFSCASDGNHGRSVSAGARLIGARAVVFLHAGVSDERAAHITRLGADIVRVGGDYHDSVEAAAKAASLDGWIAVPDTVGPGEDDAACTFVVQGYAMLIEEIIAATGQGSAFTHVLVQAGVGGLAASVFGHGWARGLFGPDTHLWIVEPERSACLYESARAKMPVRLPPGPATNMSMLECQSPSMLVWPIIEALTTGYITVTDEEASGAVRLLDQGVSGDQRLRVGESGAAGLAGLLRATAESDRKRLRLDQSAKVLLFATEGPTDLSAWSGNQ
ncbi:diaminopropionate ammonia-lyase [Bradyrhizobium sp. Arg816]|uniref:diaminopropionate ammonia-lyase n=1 Tax=Bradyrhizobium sp. Arg816 TaxID=2998491 RepID=UPI00249EF427|nr:diaminopropionate ammonia-lyase [Bradyrhizobium sp. Arg816]MDI3563398.1 diaminopropionate ammonia-lyase [Bradyrhizobium sp. Arg816]